MPKRIIDYEMVRVPRIRDGQRQGTEIVARPIYERLGSADNMPDTNMYSLAKKGVVEKLGWISWKCQNQWKALWEAWKESSSLIFLFYVLSSKKGVNYD